MRYTLKFLAAIACLSVMSFAAIPVMRITTQNNQEPTVQQQAGCWMNCTQTMNYVRVTKFELTDPNNSRNNLTLNKSDSIRVRGNSTASADKKPYRIKFEEEQSLFGRPKANSWVLLANYYDHTFALNAIAFRLGQKLGLEFTPSSQHVDLYINGSYKGIYQLTEQIQVKKSRVDVDKEKGFLVEFDYHDKASDEIKFTAAQYSLGTFIKSPEVEGCDANPIKDCNDNNTRVKWVKDTINALMNKMAESGFPTNGYRNMIDLESYAKYVLIEQFMDNFDFNSKIQNGALPGSNYAYKKMQGEKMKAGPLWDFDLSAVPVSGQSFGTRYSTYQEPIRPKHTFYQRLWSDPEFIGHFKAAWTAHKSDFTALSAFVDSISNAISGNVANNTCANPTNLMMGQSTLTTQTFTQEISKLKTWLGNRITFFDAEVNKLTGSISSSSGGTSSSSGTNYTIQVARNQTTGGNVSVKIGNGTAQTNPSGQLSATATTSITITASASSGYTFQNWTAVSGALPSNINANNASITFNINSNVNIRANFQQQQGSSSSGGATNYTLQVNRNQTHRGDVSVRIGNGTAQSNPANSISVPSGTSVSITATPTGGRVFQNWTAVSGSLPSGITATNPTITFNMNANVNIMANFQSISGGGTNYTLNVGKNPENGGSVTVNGSAPTTGQTFPSGEFVTLVATANDGYAFREWTAGSGGSLPSGIDKNSTTITFGISGNVNIAANFRENTGGGNRTDTLIIEAEDYASKNGANMVTSTNNGITNIGYIENGYSATYDVNIARNGQYTMVFKIASNGQSSFEVTVNDVPMGTVSGNTQDWDRYTYAQLSYPDVPLDAGLNTIRLDFRSAVNIDHFLIIGEAQQTTAVKPNRATVVPAVTFRASRGGFTAMLPLNHGYTQYRLIDMQGRELRSGKISHGDTDLHFNDLKRGVLLLKLEGKGTPLVLKAVTY